MPEPQLSPAKQQLLERLRRGRSGAAALRPGIPRRTASGPAPLSFGQQRFWFLHELQADSAAYNIPCAFRLRGPLHVGALACAVDALVARHEILRTTFPAADGEPVQAISPPTPVPLPQVDLGALPEPLREPEASRLASALIRLPFDLARGPLWRTLLLRLAAGEHGFVLSMHHIISDGWSIGVLLVDLQALYTATLQGEPPALPEMPVQYADFAAWQREQLRGEMLDEQLVYWQQQLAGAPRLLDLPTDRPRPPVQRSRGADRIFRLTQELPANLRELCRREQCTTFMVLLAGLGALLHRFSSQDDLLIGTPIANRNQPELAPLIGPFVNTLVLRLRPAPGLGFRAFLAKVRAVTLDAFAHAELPLDILVDRLEPERAVSHTPLFQTVFVLQNAVRGGIPHFAGLDVGELPFRLETSMFDLTLAMVEERGGDLLGRLEFNTDLFESDTIARWLDCFTVLLQGAVAEPDFKLAELPLLTAAEQRQLTTTAAPAAAGPLCLHELFAARAAEAPDAPAVSLGSSRWTYGELEARANRLARRLQSLGAGPEKIVGILLERSLDLVAAIVGVLKAGGAYLPIDLSYPAERVQFMLRDAGAVALLTQESLRGLAAGSGVETLSLDALEEELATLEGGPPRADALPENLAYVIYTSGSTGRPKGVMVTHANAARLFTATTPWFDFGPEDVWTLFHSAAFDFSVWEIWGALLYGGRLVVVPHEVSRSPEAFHRLLVDEGVTVLNQAPSAFRELARVDAERGGTGMRLRYVVFGAEALAFPSLRGWFERHGDARPQLVNMYGITETTVHVTYRPVHWADVDRALVGSPIGEPIPDLHACVLDARLQPVPRGIPGELHVGGSGPARGYLGRPDLTAERFVPDPFAAEPGGRLYRTGDLTRWRTPGDLEFLGRSDHQVKIRGYRIELGEIEERLRQHPGVREAVVVLREDTPGQRRLVAYMAGCDGGPPVAELRRSLRTALPDYMVPDAFVALDAFPRTAGGKVDRRALPAPDALRPDQEVAYVAPRNALEQTVAAVWREVLGLAEVGIHDNFFDLGGNSLLLVQVQRRLRGRLDGELPLIDLIMNPTILALARHLESGGTAPPPVPAVASPYQPQPTAAGGAPRDANRLRRRRDLLDRVREE